MMNASLRICGLLLMAIFFMANPALSSVLDESIDGPHTRPMARFDHDTHNEIAGLDESCALCHHLFDDGGELIIDESSEDMACRECHDAHEKGRPRTEAAFHNRCKGCHASMQQGPIACGECHVK